MNFSNQIKKIRIDNNLTQEQLGEKLSVSRQTISSWETNRNLPDLEMVVTIAKLFQLSLDQLILGDDTMTTKLVKDGNSKRRAKINFINLALLVISGLMFLSSALFGGGTVDANGILQEPLFFLIPLGYLFLFSALVMFVVNLVRRSFKK